MTEFMFDYEGSRGELMKFLAEFGEEPAFIARAKAPQLALDAMLLACRAEREEMLQWPRMRLAALARRVNGDWSRLGSLLADPESVSMLTRLHADLGTNKSVGVNWLESDRTALRRFVESAARFNTRWRAHVDGLDLTDVNKPRREFNEFYLLEKACALGSEIAARGFEPLEMIDHADLHGRFPALDLPVLK